MASPPSPPAMALEQGQLFKVSWIIPWFLGCHICKPSSSPHWSFIQFQFTHHNFLGFTPNYLNILGLLKCEEYNPQKTAETELREKAVTIKQAFRICTMPLPLIVSSDKPYTIRFIGKTQHIHLGEAQPSQLCAQKSWGHSHTIQRIREIVLLINRGILRSYHPRWLSGKESACQCRRRRRCGFNTWVGKEEMATASSIPAWKSHGQRSLAGYRVGHNWATEHRSSSESPSSSSHVEKCCPLHTHEGI